MTSHKLGVKLPFVAACGLYFSNLLCFGLSFIQRFKFRDVWFSLIARAYLRCRFRCWCRWLRAKLLVCLVAQVTYSCVFFLLKAACLRVCRWWFRPGRWHDSLTLAIVYIILFIFDYLVSSRTNLLVDPFEEALEFSGLLLLFWGSFGEDRLRWGL